MRKESAHIFASTAALRSFRTRTRRSAADTPSDATRAGPRMGKPRIDSTRIGQAARSTSENALSAWRNLRLLSRVRTSAATSAAPPIGAKATENTGLSASNAAASLTRTVVRRSAALLNAPDLQHANASRSHARTTRAGISLKPRREESRRGIATAQKNAGVHGEKIASVKTRRVENCSSPSIDSRSHGRTTGSIAARSATATTISECGVLDSRALVGHPVTHCKPDFANVASSTTSPSIRPVPGKPSSTATSGSAKAAECSATRTTSGIPEIQGIGRKPTTITSCRCRSVQPRALGTCSKTRSACASDATPRKATSRVAN